MPSFARSRICRALSLLVVALAGAAATPPLAAADTIVSTSTTPGRVVGAKGNSDEFIWHLLVTQIAVPVTPGQPKPAAFETWASDADVFTPTPHFPTANEPHKFRSSTLGMTVNPGQLGASQTTVCGTNGLPPNPFTGGFPTTMTPTTCIAEEVKRNRPQYDYIVNNNLNTQAGLQAAYSNNLSVSMPTTAISVKGDWVPVSTLIQWIPQLKDQATVEQTYFTTVQNGVEFALVSMHVSSKQNPAWVWATFEHEMNPGRCDYMGCYDSFGATDPAVQPNRRAYNTQYGECRKTPALRNMIDRAGLAPVWRNYCLKGSMVDYTAFGEKPASLGNSVTEGINAGISLVAASCITCHAYAAFGSNGQVTCAANAMLAQDPTGKPNPRLFKGGRTYDFMWGFLNTTPPNPTCAPSP